MRCRACKATTTRFFSLGLMPLVNSFLRKTDIPKEKKYDLTLCYCPRCHLVQLARTVRPEELFHNYIYFSSTSKKFLDHCEATARYLTRRLGFTKKSLVLEVASNDGAQLQYFQKIGIGVLGVDPAKNIARVATARGIPTIPEFFNLRFARKLADAGTRADLVFGANVLAHVPEIVDFVKGVTIVLKPEGSTVFEFPYLMGLFENKFDTIYHEHVFYYSLLALDNLFRRAGLAIYDVEMTAMQGGSLRIFASRPGGQHVSHNVADLLRKERIMELDRIESYRTIRANVERLKATLLRTLRRIKKRGKTIAAYSAPAKGNVLLNYFGIGRELLEFIVDKSKAKQGLYTPGTHLLVRPTEKIYSDKPDYLLILCWNIADEVMEEYAAYHRRGGKFIIPVPRVKIV